MPARLSFFALVLALFGFFSVPGFAAPVLENDAANGVWKAGEGKGTVEIYRRDGKYFGKIAGLTRPNWPDNEKGGLAGKPRTDRYNPDPALRDRPLIGVEFMHDFVYVGKGEWENGRIYDPESGRTYRCKMFLTKDGKLQVHGYYGFSLLGRTVTWTR